MKKLPGNLPELRVVLFRPDACPHRIGKRTVLIVVAEFDHYDKTVFFLYPHQLAVLVVIIVKSVLQKKIINVSAFQDGDHRFQLLPDLQIVAPLLTGLVHLVHGFHTDVYDNPFIYRLGEIFQHAQINGFSGVAEFIVGRNHDKNDIAVVFLDLFHCLYPVQSRHLDVHKGNVRPETLRQFHHSPSGLGCSDLTFIPEIGFDDIPQGLQHDPLVVSQHDPVHLSRPPLWSAEW